MKYVYKELKYQKEAVQSIIDVFKGQLPQEKNVYVRDLGKKDAGALDFDDDTGYSNADIALDSKTLFTNIHTVQDSNNISHSDYKETDLGHCSLDVEMETGTGKTFVYTKTMFELNKVYGWTKFIIVVPSIAIREGVYASIQDTVDYFQEEYKKKARCFIYSSSNLTQLDSFSSDANINVMIINTQAVMPNRNLD